VALVGRHLLVLEHDSRDHSRPDHDKES
jgi:hypothetical protein